MRRCFLFASCITYFKYWDQYYEKLIIASLFFFIFVEAGFTGTNNRKSKFDFTGPRDPSLIRGFDYTPANAVSHNHRIDWWVNYDSSTVEFELNLAKRLDLN